MSKRVLVLLAFCVIFIAASGDVRAQFPGDPTNPREKEELPKNIKETLAKARIAQEKKEYEELLKRTEEAVKLSGEIEKAFADSNRLTDADREKLGKLEKLVKKIRDDLGGDDDEEEADAKEEAPQDLLGAFKSLQANTSKLFDEVKRSTRYSISAVAIQSSNVVLKVLKFIRFRN